MSDTPETDAAEYYIRQEGHYVRSDFARNLERERDKAISKYNNSIKIIRLLIKEIEQPAYNVDDVIDRMSLIENAKKLVE